MNRTITACLALALLTGCSSGGDKAPTASAAKAAANAINLKAGDLPTGFTGKPASKDSGTKAQQQELLTCLGASGSDVSIVDIASDDFVKGQLPAQQTISSSVSVVPDLARAKADLASLRSSKAAGCIKTTFDKVLTEQAAANKVTIAPLQVKDLPVTATGSDGAVGFAMTTTIAVAGLSIPVEVDLLAFVTKRTEVLMTAVGIAQLVPASDRDFAFAEMVKRAAKSAV